MNKNEKQCYLRYCLFRPASLVGLVAYIMKRILQKKSSWLRSGVLGTESRYFHYPAWTNQLISNARCLEYEDSGDVLDNLPSSGWMPGDGPALSSWQIPLASFSLAYTDIDWSRQFSDKEDQYSLHRFGWLLRWMSLRPGVSQLHEAELLIVDWIDRVSPDLNGVAWETYSASERVVNWLIFLMAVREHLDQSRKINTKIIAALLDHLRFIVDHLEYHWTECNNHILNNARALYIAGRLLNLRWASEIGRSLLQKHASEMIDKAGVLLEGSSHYQLLLTRTVIEVTWVAHQTGDSDFYLELKSLAAAMLNCCLMIDLDQGRHDFENYPLVGDISPDFPVRWFTPRPLVNDEVESWWNLWDKNKIQELIENDICVDDIVLGGAGWQEIRCPDGSNKVLLHCPIKAVTYPPAHGHLDFGGFIFHDQWGPVLVDRGRDSYKGDSSSCYGVSSSAHNTLTINGLPLLPSAHGLWQSYRKYLHEDRTSVVLFSDDKKAGAIWYTNAVQRLATSLSWERKLDVRNNGISLRDEIGYSGSMPLSINIFLHLAPGWEVDNLHKNAEGIWSADLVTKERSYRVDAVFPAGCGDLSCVVGADNDYEGWQCVGYGQKVPAPVLCIKVTASMDLSIQWNLSFR